MITFVVTKGHFGENLVVLSTLNRKVNAATEVKAIFFSVQAGDTR